MKTKPFTKYASIYHEGKCLKLEMEYYKTVVNVYIIDKSKYFPVVDKIKVKRNSVSPSFTAREYAIEKGYF